MAPIPQRRPCAAWVATALASTCVVAVDAWTKDWALVHARGWPPLAPWPGLEFSVTFNQGSAFGLGHQVPGVPWVLIVLSLAMCVGLGWLSWRLLPQRTAVVPLALALGGTLGNLADRTLRTLEVWGQAPRRAVVDFIVVHLGRHATWPAFNLADVALAVGLPWIAILLLRDRSAALAGR